MGPKRTLVFSSSGGSHSLLQLSISAGIFTGNSSRASLGYAPAGAWQKDVVT